MRGKGDGEGPISRDGDPGAETRGPRAPGRLKAELLGGPSDDPSPIEAKLELRFPRGSTCVDEKSCKNSFN